MAQRATQLLKYWIVGGSALPSSLIELAIGAVPTQTAAIKAATARERGVEHMLSSVPPPEPELVARANWHEGRAAAGAGAVLLRLGYAW